MKDQGYTQSISFCNAARTKIEERSIPIVCEHRDESATKLQNERRRVYLGLGSNLVNPPLQLKRAISEINKLPLTNITKISNFYWNKFEGASNQADCLNGVVALDTLLEPEELLIATQEIEKKQGRTQKNLAHLGRTIDIDILLYKNLILTTELLTIPHPHMKSRGFVLVPLAEITNELVLPTGENLSELLPNVRWEGVKLEKPKIHFG